MLTLRENDELALETAAGILLNGGVIAVPTETVYGLATLWNNEAGRAKIYALKHRPANKLLQMLAATTLHAERAGLQNSITLEKIVAAFCPGALTIVAPDRLGGSIGMRIPNHPFLLKLLNRLEQPLAATSANLSGMPPALNAADAVKELDGEPELLIDGGAIPATGGMPSTVVSILKSSPEILRSGPITLQQILASLS